ncbi:hypothetical protein [Candidatus Bathycorpusculum sp.]|uniref:hypothetical protein n=1 Tax=Candidatus Bathycorpusculum sp. TaxID=2994959 RepID=UPI00281E442B|nr:hypothetical protein [Candidatus Termitimicrobium sp.]
MSRISCDKKNCVNHIEGYCSLSNPEKEGNSCIDYEDEMDFTRLKVDVARGTLG